MNLTYDTLQIFCLKRDISFHLVLFFILRYLSLSAAYYIIMCFFFAMIHAVSVRLIAHNGVEKKGIFYV